MNGPIKVVDIELSQPIVDIEALDAYTHVQGLVRLHGTPLGYVQVPIIHGCCWATSIRRAVLEQMQNGIANQILLNALSTSTKLEDIDVETLLSTPTHVPSMLRPLVTVAVCTRNRSDELALCLDALDQLEYEPLEILIVDNAPDDDTTKQLVHSRYPTMRYVCEPRPGLDWARNRAITEANGEIIAYTDDDVVVDPGWVSALVKVFTADPNVMLVTGLVVPYELKTKAQRQFEVFNGFGRGFQQQWVRVDKKARHRWVYWGAGRYGTGANMAYRRCIFEKIGGFDPALDVGTVTNGGGDLEMFFRLLHEGYTLVYEPNAIVRHRHRRERQALETQMRNNGIGFCSYVVRSCLHFPKELFGFLRLMGWWVFRWCLPRIFAFSLKYPLYFRKLAWLELWGGFVGVSRYFQARQKAAQLMKDFDEGHEPAVVDQQSRTPHAVKERAAIAVRTTEVTNLIHTDLAGVEEYAKVHIFITCYQELIGHLEINNQYQSVSKLELFSAFVQQLGYKLLFKTDSSTQCMLQDLILSEVSQYLQGRSNQKVKLSTPERPLLPNSVSVSIVIATLDRPADLHTCLKSLQTQRSDRPVEIVVVDNNPTSGKTATVVSEFPNVVLIQEPRQGLSYARNAGILASCGDIIVTIDDDVITPPNWLEYLLAPFSDPAITAVTGNVLPLEIETNAQRLFEWYGGLGKGYERFDVDKSWLDSFEKTAVPTWILGATANAAFRSYIFQHPKIGLLEETLGAGMPAAVGEDTYLFYKILKSGGTILYEPTAHLWHKHRNTEEALRRQIFGYSKGHVAYHLTTLLHDKDKRALLRLGIELPLWHMRQLAKYVWLHLVGWDNDYPLSLIGLEVVGNILGPWSMWQSHQRVRREGRSLRHAPAYLAGSSSKV